MRKIKPDVLATIFGFEQNKWRIHRELPELNIPLSPFKFKITNAIRSNHLLCDAMSDSFIEKIKQSPSFDAVGELPLGISPVAALVAYKLKKELITLNYKEENSDKEQIIGEITNGKRVIILEDVLSFGHSKVDGINLAVSSGLVIEEIIVFLDYEMGAREQIENKFNIKVRSVFKISELLDLLKDELLADRIKGMKAWLSLVKTLKIPEIA